MWHNMTWLAAEWRYWFEWRKLALSGRLEGKDELPPKNNPFVYTFRWIGVAVAFPITVVSLLGVVGWVLTTYPEALHVAYFIAGVLCAIGLLLWIINSCIEMDDVGPNHVVVEHWNKIHRDEKPQT